MGCPIGKPIERSPIDMLDPQTAFGAQARNIVEDSDRSHTFREVDPIDRSPGAESFENGMAPPDYRHIATMGSANGRPHGAP
jgi:hypothetical protein